MSPMDRERWRAMEPLLDEALDLGPAERAEWIAALRARAPREAHDLEVLLAVEVDADRRGFLQRPHDVRPPDRVVGDWTLERQIGEGGMGAVWLARRDGAAGTRMRAAVKLLHMGAIPTTSRERFRREGALLARLAAHPGIARLLDAGVTSGGQPYLVLEHVDGERIDQWVERHALPRDARLRLFLQVLAAVGHAHAHHIVHRDLKPSNILVTPAGVVKLLDFGIAKLLDADEADGEWRSVTTARSRVLTPEFAAPEQITGQPVGTATDVYAAGVLLYLLLTGRHPTAEGCATRADAIRAQLESHPAPLGVDALDAILTRAMQRDPAARQRDARELSRALEGWLADPHHDDERAESGGGGGPAHAAIERLRAFLRHLPHARGGGGDRER